MKPIIWLNVKFYSISVGHGGEGLHAGGTCFLQQPGERLVLFHLRRDMYRKEVKSAVHHSLPKYTADPRRMYSGWGGCCLLLISQVGKGSLALKDEFRTKTNEK